jgi:hypothetical protein
LEGRFVVKIDFKYLPILLLYMLAGKQSNEVKKRCCIVECDDILFVEYSFGSEGGLLQLPKQGVGVVFWPYKAATKVNRLLPLVSVLGTGVSVVGPLERYADPLALSTGDLAARGLRCGMC